MDKKGRYLKGRNKLELDLSKKKKKIYEAIYQAITLSFQPLLKTLMNANDETTMSAINQSIRSSHVLLELQNILAPQYQLSSIKFDQIIEGLQAVLEKHCEHILNVMTKQEKQFYSNVLALNQHLLDMLNHKKSNRTNTNTFTNLSIEKLFKVDILSIFFMKSQYYGKKYHSKNAILPPKLLIRIFKFDEKQYEVYSTKFTQLTKMISFRYKDQFKEIIDLFCLVEMKIKISNMVRKFGKATTKKSMEQIKLQANSQQSNIVKQQFVEEQVHYKYSLCELILVANSMKDIDDTPHKVQNKIVQRLDCILNKEPEKQISHQILKISIQWNVTFRSIVEWLLRMKNNSKLRVQIIKQKQQKITELNVCRWIFLKKAGLNTILINLLPSLSLEYFNSKQNHDHIMTFLCRLIVERFRLYSTVLIAQRRIERYLLIPSIYACRFQYQYNNPQQYSESNFNENSSDPQKGSSLISTALVITNGFKIVMGAITPERVNCCRYIQILAEYFKSKKIKHANLVIFQLSFDRNFLERSLIRSVTNFKAKYNSNIYVSNSTQEFQLHFAINAYITSGLARSNPSKSSFHKIIEKQAIKIMAALQSPQIYPKNLFNQYSIKEAIGSIDYQNFHLELNEKNKKEEALKFYRQTYQNAKCYQNNQKYRSYWNTHIKQQYVNTKMKSCIFENIKPFQLQNQQKCIADLNEEDMKELRQRQTIFAAHFISQMKWRHPYLTHEEVDSIRQDLHCFMKQHHLKSKIVKALLEEIPRNMLVYQAYLQNILHECALNHTQEDLIASCQNEISYLAHVYSSQNYHIDDLLPGFREQFFTTLTNCQVFQGMHLRQLPSQFESQSANRKMMERQEVALIQPINSARILNTNRQQQQKPEYPVCIASVGGIISLNPGQNDCNPNDKEQLASKANVGGQLCQKFGQYDLNENDEEQFEGKHNDGQVKLCQKKGQGISTKSKSQCAYKANSSRMLCQRPLQFDCNGDEEEGYVQPRQYFYSANVEQLESHQSHQLEFQQ